MREWRGKGEEFNDCAFFPFFGFYSSSLPKAEYLYRRTFSLVVIPVIKTLEKNYSFDGMGTDGKLVGIICPHVFW